MPYPGAPEPDDGDESRIVQCQNCKARVDLENDSNADQICSVETFESAEDPDAYHTKVEVYVCVKCRHPMFTIPAHVIKTENEIEQAIAQREDTEDRRSCSEY